MHSCCWREQRGGDGAERGQQKHKHVAGEGERRRKSRECSQLTGNCLLARGGTPLWSLVLLPECSVALLLLHGTQTSRRGVPDTEAQMLTLSADMDESSSLLDLLECSVCLERLDTTAKVLPCQHTFCRRCLENIVSSRNELRCPECRILVDCGVDDLPANILLVRLLDGIKQRPQRGSGGGMGAGRQSLVGGSLQGYAAGISAAPPGSAIRELPVANRSSPVKVGHLFLKLYAQKLSDRFVKTIAYIL